MAEKIKKGFFKVLPLSVVVFLVFGLVVSFTMPTPQNPEIQPAEAAAGDGASSALWLLDTNTNGKIDRITMNIANPNFAGEPMTVQANWNTCLDVQYGGADITISGTPTVVSTADPAVLTINLDESDTDLAVNTDAVTTASEIEVIYTGAAVGQCIDDTSDEDLNDIATGDSGVTDTEVDKAAPYLVSATYSDSNSNGKIDRVAWAFSETTTFTTITAADWLFGNPADLTFTGDFQIGDCAGSPGVTITCTDAANAHFDSDANRTGKQTTAGSEPTIAYTNNTNDINDGAAGNNTATFGARSLTDGAAPIIVTRVTKDTDSAEGAAGTVDGDLDGVLVTFTEAMDASSVAVTDFAISLNDDTAKTEAYTDTTDDTTLFFGLSDPTANDTSNLLKLQITGGDGILDYAGVSFAAEGAASAATDGAAPYLVSATYRDSDNAGNIDGVTFVFSESTTWTAITPDDWAFAAGDIGLAGDFLITDCTPSPATTYICTDAANAHITSTASRTGKQTTGGTEPTFTYTNSGANDINDTVNNTATFGPRSLADGALPVLLATTLSSASDRNVLTFTYSEYMTVTDGASTATKGDLTTAGQVEGFGTFITAGVAGNVTVPTTKNTVGGNNSTSLTVILANETAGYLDSTSTTEPSSVFTPVASAEVDDASSNQVNIAAAAPTATGGGTWDLAKPTITSVTFSDAAGDDGKIDKADLVFDTAVRDANIANADATLGGLAGTFATGLGNDTATSFNITDPSTQPVNTAAGAHTSFLYNGATSPITDLAGNLLNTATDGQIKAADVDEADGALPIVTAVTLSSASDRNVLTFTYSEAVVLPGGDGASTASKGDITTAGQIEGIGTFITSGTPGNVTVPTTKNSISGSTTATITIVLANETAGYMNSTSTTEPSGVFTPVASATITDAATLVNQVNPGNTPTATGGASWDLTKPILTTGTVSDASGSNGKVDKIDLVFDTAVRDANIADADATLGGLAGTFSTGLGNDTATSFNLTSDAAQPVNTGLGAHTSFLYSAATSPITDLAGNLLDTATDGVVVAGDVIEIDGAAPILVSATYRDLDSNGAVDTLRTTWSENVLMSGSTADDWTIAAGSSINAAFSAAANDLVAGTTLDVTVTADAYETSSAVAPTIAYDNDDANDSVTDSALTPIVAGSNAPVTATDGAAPVISAATFYDADAAPNDGKLDIITVVWSENISAVADGSGDWALTSAANFAGIAEGTVECNSGSAAANECDYNFTTTTVKTSVGDLSLAYTAGTSVTDGTNTAASKTITSASTPAFTDGANPVVASTSPANAATGVALDASFSITFSEAMTTTDITTTTLGRSPTFALGSVNGTWTVGNTVVTFASHDPWAGLQIYTINLVEGSINSAAAGDSTLDNSAIVADPYTFTTVAASSGGGGGGGGLPPSITVTLPNSGETLTGGGTYNIIWSAPSVTDTVSIYYSLDSGINFPYTVATGETNDGSYTWTVPNIGTGTAKIKLVAGSLSDISDGNFNITYTTPTVSLTNSTVVASPTSVVANGTSFSTITVTVKDAASVPLSGKVVSLASSRGSSDTITTVTGTTSADGKATFDVYSSTAGTSTYTATAQGTVLSNTVSVVFTAVGEPTTPAEGETPTSIQVGDLIKSSLSTSVYYYGSDNKRHLFPNEKTYKSWFVDWSNIKTVTVSQLQGISLGHNVTVRPGTVLVKIQTDPKVYAVEPNGLLRWVPTEARAATLYGSAWATKIIDVPLVFWVDYSFGSDIATDAHPTGAIVQYTGTTDKYYIQGSERRLISTAGFTANNFQLSHVLSIPTTLSYTLGTPLTAEETALSRIY